MRTLYFEQITDNRLIPEEECLSVLNERVEIIKTLLNLEGVTIKIEKPRFIDWTESTKQWETKVNLPEERRLKGRSIQYRVGFRVNKTTRKITWNDIYKLVNSVKAVPYSFI